MPRKTTAGAPETPAAVAHSTCVCGSVHPVGADGHCFDCRVTEWPEHQILAHKHFGPAVIGKAQYAYVQQYATRTADGIFGPALLGIVPDAYQDQRPLAKAEA